MSRHVLPADIERTSMRIIAEELEQSGIHIPEEHRAVVQRVIHTTADFEYAKTLYFTEHAVERGISDVQRGEKACAYCLRRMKSPCPRRWWTS